MRSISRWAAPASALLAFLALTAAPRPARAEWEPISQRVAVGGDIYWWSSHIYGSVLPIVPFLHVDVARHVYLDAQLPLATWIDGYDDKARFGMGNPTVGVHYANSDGALSYYLGGRLSAPLGALHDNDWQLADQFALVAMAGYDSFLFAPGYLPLSGMFGLEIQPVRPLWIRLALDPIILIKIGRAGRDDRNAGVFGMQQKFEIEGRADMGIGGGFALQGVFQFTRAGGGGFFTGGLLPDSDRAQLAAEPFFSYDKGALFLRVGILIALDEPLGFGFDESSPFFGPKVATGHFQIGGRF